MAALPYMQLYVADYLADTAHLSTLEHGAYLLLIFNYWQRGESFRAKDEQSLNRRLASVARMSNDEWMTVREALEEFFTVTETEWSHDRIDRDLEAVNSKSEKAKAAGKASAASREASRNAGSEQTINGRSTNAEQTLNHTDTDTDKEKTLVPSATGQVGQLDLVETDASEDQSPKTGYSEAFEEAWAEYPKRLKTGSTAEQMIDGVKRYAAFIRETGKEGSPFVKHAKSFFGPDLEFLEPWTTAPTSEASAPLVLPEGDDMVARGALWKFCLEAGISGDEVRGQPASVIRELILDRHPRSPRRPKLRAINGGRAA
jgi:uncharacterized protein YdaU (DUF1376 family)